MARLHSFYISNAQQELNYAGKNLSEDAFNQIMQDYAKSLTLYSDMFEINDDNDDDDPFENLIPEEEEENNDQLNEDDSNLLVGNLIKLNNVNREDIELEEVDHGDLEFSVDDILANLINANKWQFDNLTIRQFDNSAIRQFGNLAIWQFGNTAIWHYGITALQRFKDAIPTIKKGMATLYKQVPDEIKLYVDNPKGPEKELKQDDMISKHFNIDHIEEGLILIYPVLKPKGSPSS
ncbi:hypothetical protein RhiirC2_794994 [Rhizophagus irregularis]|uniref:Uncharacterized protein n=1 Tax=Rhizophagus irregularis TaxID=588596 RepID=A0A2N1MCF1_9GLOM|nr:hypothetical protein RhiirC2_794994 [Rhizophagus irregularis]